ncbi:Uncharacterised protein [Candidatus Venteria ishoeyi]|uniref:LysM domain-containing protein n=1 Tax=Candidatus Venteria ishoeyi TaxID=1899563 RepID=A0A1H6F9G0_9GAMM|nr:Uncharacterised protein [Candidatus Venteria ishoeyi]
MTLAQYMPIVVKHLSQPKNIMKIMPNQYVHRVFTFLFSGKNYLPAVFTLLIILFAYVGQNVHAVPALPASYGPIKSGETLYSIARHLYAEQDVVLDAAVLALLEKNPNAFSIPCNINTLLRGKILQVAALTTVQDIDPKLAQVETKRQLKNWKNRIPGTALSCEQTFSIKRKLPTAIVQTEQQTSESAQVAAQATQRLIPSPLSESPDQELSLLQQAPAGETSALEGKQPEDFQQIKQIPVAPTAVTIQPDTNNKNTTSEIVTTEDHRTELSEAANKPLVSTVETLVTPRSDNTAALNVKHEKTEYMVDTVPPDTEKTDEIVEVLPQQDETLSAPVNCASNNRDKTCTSDNASRKARN